MKLSYLYGTRFSDWFKLLRDNGFQVHPRYLHRAALITASSCMISLLGSIERFRFRRVVDETEVETAPLFILGHWRSGTAYLQNLMSSDRGLATPNVYQTFSPHTFLSWEKISSGILTPFLPPTRGFDNMDLHLQAPEEDEFALAIAGSCSLYLGMMFPRHEAAYRRYLTLADLAPEELERWKSTFLWFVKKLTCRTRRPLILRSPPHTARVRVLLDLFPQARFVHIYRHPWRVFQSCRHFYSYMYQHVAFLQRPDLTGLDERIIELHKEMYEAFERDRPLIDPTRYSALRFEDLVADPVGQMESIYRHFNLPDFSLVRPELERYLMHVEGYRKNVLPDLSAAEKTRINREWMDAYRSWNYPV